MPGQTMKSNKDKANGEHHVNGENHGESGDVCSLHDSLKTDCCIQCKKRSGRVLICSQNGCPVAVHEACMTWKLVFDDVGNFYCTYCLYKREKAKFKESRMKNDRAREFDNVGNLGTTEEVDGNEIENGEETSVPKAAKKTSFGDSENVTNDDDEPIHYNHEDEEKSDKGSISRGDGVDDVGEGEKMEEDIEVSSDSKDNSLDLVVFEFPSPLSIILPDDQSFQSSTTSENVDMYQERKTKTDKSSAERPQPTKRPTTPIARDTGKHRKRMQWTDAEVDMLQALVHSFSSEVNKNMPWRKILERGRDVFHSTRMPGDLKDKWKRIVAKELSEG